MSWKKQKVNGIDIPDGLAVQYTEIPLFPDIDIQPPTPVTEQEISMYQIQKEFNLNMQNSLFYSLIQEKRNEMERYSDRFLVKQRVYKQYKKNLKFFPEELHKSQKKIEIQEFDLKKLENLDDKVKQESEDGSQVDEEEVAESEEENDYGVDYYDDEHDAFGEESDGGGADF